MDRREFGCVSTVGKAPGTGEVMPYLAQVVSAHFGALGPHHLAQEAVDWENLGRSPGPSASRQASVGAAGEGQFLGGGSRKPSSTALIT